MTSYFRYSDDLGLLDFQDNVGSFADAILNRIQQGQVLTWLSNTNALLVEEDVLPPTRCSDKKLKGPALESWFLLKSCQEKGLEGVAEVLIQNLMEQERNQCLVLHGVAAEFTKGRI